MNDSISILIIEIIINNFTRKKVLDPSSFTGKSYQTFMEEITRKLQKPFQTVKEQVTLGVMRF